MRSLKTLLALLLLGPQPGHTAEPELMPAFAACAGRLSAEREHAWLMADRDSTEIERRRDQFIDLIDAATPPERLRHALSLRVEAKRAHADLLLRASFSIDPELSRWAQHRAQYEIALCGRYLLES